MVVVECSVDTDAADDDGATQQASESDDAYKTETHNDSPNGIDISS